MNAIINKENLKNNIINNGYTTIENFLNIDEINKIKNSLLSMLQYINKSDEYCLTKKSNEYLYYDGYHVTENGARLIGSGFSDFFDSIQSNNNP